MRSQPDVNMEDVVYDQIVNKGGEINAIRTNLEENVARAVGLKGLPRREVYVAVCNLVTAGRLARRDYVDDGEEYGSLPDPKEVSVPVAKYSVVKK